MKRAIYRSNDTARQITDRLDMDQVVRRYGFEPNRNGYIKCPFHKGDDNASLKIYPGNRGWYCFGCGAGHSVIDFVMRLFDLDFKQALVRINSDFGLGLSASGGPSVEEASRYLQQRAKEQKELEAFRKEYQEKTLRYRELWDAVREGEDHPLYVRAMWELPNLDDWFDENPWR